MIKKIIAWALYIPCLWLFIEGASYTTTYTYYTYVDKINQTTPDNSKLPTLRHFSKHPFFYPTEKTKPIYRYDAILGARHTPNAIYSGLGIDSFGFIHNGNALHQPFIENEAIKVVLLGGSSMAGVGAFDNRCTIASYLERLLNNNNSNIKYEVVNAGVGGYSSTSELSYFIIELVNYNPDIVVALDGWNDFWHSFPLASDAAVYRDWAIPQRTNYQRSVEAFINSGKKKDKSIWEKIEHKRFTEVFWYTLRLLFGDVLDKPFQGKKPFQYGKSVWGDNSIYVRDKINNTHSHIPFMEKNWRSLIGAATANDIKPIVLLQPVLPITEKRLTESEATGYNSFFTRRYSSIELYEKSIRIFYKEAKLMINELKKYFSGSKGVILEDISNIFNDEIDSMFVDPIHYSRFGNRKIAKFIASKISDNSSDFVDTLCNPNSESFK